MNLPTFGQLLSEYMLRSGISDSELARSIGVRRQTIFRWKEGLVERPRSREDVLQCAKKLRLTDQERDRLLLAAGFAPEQMAPDILYTAAPDPIPVTSTRTALLTMEQDSELAQILVEAPAHENAVSSPTPLPDLDPALLVSTLVDSPVITEPSASLPLAPLSTSPPNSTESIAPTLSLPTTAPPTATTPAPLLSLPPRLQQSLQLLTDRRLRWWPAGAGLLVVLLLGLLWTRSAPFMLVATPTPLAPATVVLYPPPQTTPTAPTYPVARKGETLLLVAQFTGYTTERYNVAGRISEELETQIAEAKLVSTTVVIWTDPVPNAAQASELLAASRATLVLWGEYDSGRVRVNLETNDPQNNQKHDFTLTSADALVTTINSTVPTEIRVIALMALGRLLRNQEKYQAATAVFERALALAPEDKKTAATLNFYLGYLAEKATTLSDFNRARNYYTRAIALDSELYIAYYNRGTVQIKRYGLQPLDEQLLLETLDSAIADFSLVIAQRPTDADAYLNRGVAYYERDGEGDMSAALRDLSHVIALKAEYTHAYFLRGLVQIRANTGRGWVDDFQRVLALQPDHSGAISGLCWGYVLDQQPETALPYCDQAVTLDATNASRDSRAIAYAQLGRYVEAIADFRTYLASPTLQQSANMYQRLRGPQIEQWLTQLAAAENPFDPALLDQLRHRDHY